MYIITAHQATIQYRDLARVVRGHLQGDKLIHVFKIIYVFTSIIIKEVCVCTEAIHVAATDSTIKLHLYCSDM